MRKPTRRELHELECRVRLVELAQKHDPQAEGLDLWTAGFWAGIRSYHARRPLEQLIQIFVDAGGDPEILTRRFHL